MTQLQLPPGSMGLPLLGETLAIARNMTAFLMERGTQHGNVFKSHVFGRPVAFVSGPEGATAFLDPERVDRAGGHPAHVRELFGGTNINMYNGPKHAGLKRLLLKGFSKEAFESYLPDIERLIEGSLSGLVGREARWTDELRKLAIEAICLNVMGIAPGERTDQMRADYALVLQGMTSIPIPLPGTAYTRARQARDRLLAVFAEVITEHRKSPSEDGLSRILQAKLDDGTQMTDAEASLELHHTVIAGYIVFGILMSLGLQLEQQPNVRARAQAEVDALPQGPLTLGALMRLPYLMQLVLEAKRHAPILPLVFGTAKKDFELYGFTVPKGWGVFWALTVANMDPKIFKEPARFDPDRFSPERAEHKQHEHAFVPQGSGPDTGHKCLGADYSTVLSLAFAVHLLRGYTWSFPQQNLTFRYDLTPAEPADGLRVRVERR
jgi:cytochrome P450